jgi:citrate synthase
LVWYNQFIRNEISRWLLCTGDIPNQKQVKAVSKEWANRASLPQYIVQMLDNFPPHVHPMAQFTSTIAALQSESKFAEAYAKGVSKASYWE